MAGEASRQETGRGTGRVARRGTLRFGPSALATPANVVTLARLVLGVPFLVFVAAGGASWPAVTGWAVLAVSDWYDGLLARREGTTRSGAFLDPLADKVITVGGFVALAAGGVYHWLPVTVIGVREVAVSAYRARLGRRGVSVPARRLGKVKTVVQLLAVGAALAPLTEGAGRLTQGLLWLAVALTVVSAWEIVARPAPAAAKPVGGPSR